MSDVYKILKLEKMCSGWHSSRGKGLQSERVLGLIPVKVSTFFPLDFGFFTHVRTGQIATTFKI